MNAKELTEFHSLVKQFQSEMSLKDICSQEGVDYRSFLSWRNRNILSKSLKARVPTTMVVVEVTDLPPVRTSVGSANARIEFESGFVLDRRTTDAGSTIQEILNTAVI